MTLADLTRIEIDLIRGIQSKAKAPLTWILIAFTITGYGKFWWAMALGFNAVNLWTPVIPQQFLRAFFSPLVVWMINGVVKRTVRRMRPATASPDIIALVRTPPCFSFPSSHAGSTFAFYFILLWWNFPGAHYFGVWAAIVSFSRMYLGVHYLTDVLGGIFVGLIASLIVYSVF